MTAPPTRKTQKLLTQLEMTPVVAAWLSGGLAVCALVVVVMVSAFPVSPPSLLDTSMLSGNSSEMHFYLEDGQYGGNCALAPQLMVDQGTPIQNGLVVSCSLPRKEWHQLLGETAAVAIGPFAGLCLVIVRWLCDTRRRGVELPGRRRPAIDAALATLGLALFAVTLNDEISVIGEQRNGEWVSYYSHPTWASEFLTYASNIGLGLFLGAAISLCITRIEARLERFLTR